MKYYRIREVYTFKKLKIPIETLYSTYDAAIAELTEILNSREKTYLTELNLIGVEDGIVLYVNTIYRRE